MELSGMICRIGIKIRIKPIRNNRDFIIISDINESSFTLNVKMTWLIVIHVHVTYKKIPISESRLSLLTTLSLNPSGKTARKFSMTKLDFSLIVAIYPSASYSVVLIQFFCIWGYSLYGEFLIK